MDDVPASLKANAYGAYEPEGMCIWINKEKQSSILTGKDDGVVAHEFAHYIHSFSTWHGVADLLSLIGQVHAGIQRLEDQSKPIILPLAKWANQTDCPQFICQFVGSVKKRERAINDSYGIVLDKTPHSHSVPGMIYQKDGGFFIKMTSSVGVPVKRRALMEGPAVLKKCEVLQNSDDLKAKQSGHAWLYVAAHKACETANALLDPMQTTKYLCDISLCAQDMGQAFTHGIRLLEQSDRMDEFLRGLIDLYDSDCRPGMDSRQEQVDGYLKAIAPDHTEGESKSWAVLALENAMAAIKQRQLSPLSLIEPVYIGDALHQLAREVGSPVIITNDMRLTSLIDAGLPIRQARNSTRTISYLCNWIINDRGKPLTCPYAGCPDCPSERTSMACKTDARKVLALPGNLPECCLSFSARQLRVVEILTQ